MHGIRGVIKIAANPWHQGTVWGIMKILGFLPDTVMAGVLQATFNAALAWSFVTYESFVSSKS